MKLTLDTLPMYCRRRAGCLLWAQGLNSAGYPQARLDGATRMVRRYVFVDLMGGTIAPGQMLTSRCNNPLCVTPGCMFTAAHGDILRRAYRTRARSIVREYSGHLHAAKCAGFVKLNEAKVADIRSRPDEEAASLAAEFGVTTEVIWDIRAFRTWKAVGPINTVEALARAS